MKSPFKILYTQDSLEIFCLGELLSILDDIHYSYEWRARQ